tara:strand:+ start:4122 stop:4523 length:402 start_codon:yes stop_codon:yes gene_type:complete
MKINLVIQESQFLDGYDNHIIAPDTFEKIPDAVCTEILMIDSLDYIPPDTLGVIVRKLRHGGVLQIVSTDLFEICRSIFLGLIPMEQCNLHLTNGRLKLVPAMQVKQQLEGLGLEVKEMAMKNIKYDIKAQRP